jgi:hypothetical protein
MKKLTLLFATLMMLSGLHFAARPAQAQKDASYRGEIMDSDCAKMGQHPEPDAKQCTVDCVKEGSTYVLFNAAEKSVYQLDDQKKPVAFAGKKVVVTGTLDKATKTIHITGIKAA